jgi:transketolase
MFKPGDKPVATREAFGRALNTASKTVRTLIGGSADLAGSTKAALKDGGSFGPDFYAGRNIHFGVREHAMGSIANGLALHGGAIPFAATFLVFSDYMRPAIRLASLMGIRVVFVFSHDSIGVGEDGPTHQPVEHIMALRTIPGLVVIRPADATETVEAWKTALERRNGPTVFITTRQSLPVLDRTAYAPAEGLRRGGYVLWEANSSPEAILLATGSEVHLALEAGRLLKDKGIAARVVSLPSWELFEAQPKAYREGVLPPSLRTRVSIEAGITLGWERYVGCDGVAIGVNRFGASAPGPMVYERLGLTARHAADEVMKLLGRDR